MRSICRVLMKSISRTDGRLVAAPIQSIGRAPLQTIGRAPMQIIGSADALHWAVYAMQSNGRAPMQSIGRAPMQSIGRAPLQSIGRAPLMQIIIIVPMQTIGDGEHWQNGWQARCCFDPEHWQGADAEYQQCANAEHLLC
jgi:hypothetical protein